MQNLRHRREPGRPTGTGPVAPARASAALVAALLTTSLLAGACADGDSDADATGAHAASASTDTATAAGERPELPRREPTGAAVDRRVAELPPDFDPVVWTDAPPRPAMEGPLAVNNLIEQAEIFGEEQLEGAEDVVLGLDGQLYTGTTDGGVWRLNQGVNGAIESSERVATVEGRPLGLAAYSENVLIAAVAEQGVMAVDVVTGDAWVLTDRLDGNLIFFADEVTVAADGTIYFTEASTVYFPGFPNDLLDGRPNGRLLCYEPSTGVTDVVADGLYFANGIDIAPDESYVLVAESFRLRITRVWLDEGREGTTEQFGPYLINGPDNITVDDRGRVWVGGSDLRSDAVDALITNADLRRQVAAMPPGGGDLRAPYGFALVLSPEGEPVFSFHDTTGRYYAVSSALPHNGHVIFGSLADRGIARIPLPPELNG